MGEPRSPEHEKRHNKPPGEPREPVSSTTGGISRRRILQLGGAGGVALAAKTLVPPAVRGVGEFFRIPSSSEVRAGNLKRMEKAGFGQFSELFVVLDDFSTRYGKVALPPDAGDLLDTLRFVAYGNYDKDSTEVVRWRDGWGEKKGESFDVAKAKIPTINIDPKNTGDKPEKIRDFLTTIAGIVPGYLIATPDQIELVIGGGSLGKSSMMLNSIRDRKGEGHIPLWAMNVAFHEMTHAIHQFTDRIKPYVSQAEYIKYLTTYMSSVDHYIQAWVSVPNDETILVGKDGIGSEYDLVIIDWEERFPEFKVDGVPGDAQKDRDKRYSAVAHSVTKKALEIGQKEKPTYDEEAFIHDPKVRGILAHVADRITHRFVSFGPPSEDWGYSESSVHGTLHNQVNMQRLRTFAPSWTPDSTYYDIYDAFNIPHTAKL